MGSSEEKALQQSFSNSLSPDFINAIASLYDTTNPSELAIVEDILDAACRRDVDENKESKGREKRRKKQYQNQSAGSQTQFGSASGSNVITPSNSDKKPFIRAQIEDSSSVKSAISVVQATDRKAKDLKANIRKDASQNAREPVLVPDKQVSAAEASKFEADRQSANHLNLSKSSSSHSDDSSSRNDRLLENSHEENILPRSTSDLIELSDQEDLENEGFLEFKVLLDMFPTILFEVIKQTFQDYDSDLEKSTDALLDFCFGSDTQSFGESEASSSKGIDGFAQEEEDFISQKRAKRQRKFRRKNGNVKEEPLPQINTTNVWNAADPYIDFFFDRTSVTATRLRSVFLASSGSFPRALIALLEEDYGPQNNGSEDTLNELASLLAFVDTTFPKRLLVPLLRLTDQSAEHAYDLLKKYQETLDKEQAQKPVIPSAPLVPQYKPYNPHADSTNGAWKTVSGQKPASSSTNIATSMDLGIVRNNALASAASAHRRANKANNMGAVAAHYSAEARAANVKLQSTRAAEADSFVAANSTKSRVDLHGVDVKNGVRIALDRAYEWVDSHRDQLSELKPGRNGPELEIITGRGVHSVGGLGKMGPAVLRALNKEGFKVGAGEGVVWVSGRKI